MDAVQNMGNCDSASILPEGVPPFIHINQNIPSGQRPIKPKEDDIAVCECKYDANDPDSACGDRCLNVLTSSECIYGYCPCSVYCKNQRFQKCEYARTKLFKTEGRGWGLLVDEHIKAGQFIIEYCGEIISSEEANQRSQTYEAHGLRDAYIISLNANYFIDATTKGSLARFINHSCQPNCETRKWTVLGETRVGIFAKQEISAGTELSYDYNFEWYGGATVRCLCGAPNCSIFLGAKSHGFQEHNHVWEDGDDRYTVDMFPLYDSAEDEACGKENYVIMSGSLGTERPLESNSVTVESLNSFPVEAVPVDAVKIEVHEETKLFWQNTPQKFPRMNASLNCNIGSVTTSNKKSTQHLPKNRSKDARRKQVNGKHVAKLFASKEAQEEILKNEELRREASNKLSSVYDEIRPAIEEHERDRQENVPITAAQKWIEATCDQYKADFNFHSSIVKNFFFSRPRVSGQTNPWEGASRVGGSKEEGAD